MDATKKDAVERPLQCPYCHGAFAAGERAWACPRCGTPHHLDCAVAHEKCTVLGCGAPAPLARVQPVSAPPSGAAGAVVLGVAVALLLASGVGFYVALRKAPAAARPARRPRVARASPDPARLARVTLDGPGGPVTLPLGDQPVLVNVWLEGCADCMPAFEQYPAAKARFPQGVRVVNVSAFREPSPDFVARYGLEDALVWDQGAAVVQPLGISSFTTLLLDADGRVLFRGRPDHPGYLEGLAEAAAKLEVEAPASFESELPFTVLDEHGKVLGRTPGAVTVRGAWSVAPRDPIEARRLLAELRAKAVTGLWLEGELARDADVKPLLEVLTDGAPLRRLRLAGGDLSPSSLALVAQLPVARLDLTRAELTDAGLEKLASSATIEELVLDEARGFSEEGLAALGRLPALRALWLRKTGRSGRAIGRATIHR